MLDIFKPIISEDGLHRKFKMLTSDIQFEGQRRILEEWVANFVDRDGKIIYEFQDNFHSSFWEFYLSALFNEMKFKMDTTKDRPDFYITAPHNLYVEAVVSNIKDSGRKEDDRNFSDFLEMFSPIFAEECFDELMDEAITRYSNSILNKANLYNTNYSKCEWVNQESPFAIALGAYDQISYGREFIFPMLALLYGHYFNSTSKEFERLKYTRKPGSNAKINLGLFHDERFSHVSAIIFSCTVTLGKLTSMAISKNYMKYSTNTVINTKYRSELPHFVCQIVDSNNPETLSDGLFVFHNPNAKNKIPFNVFDHEDITQITYDYEDNEFRLRSNDYPLVARVNFVTMNNQMIISEMIQDILSKYNS